MEKIADGSLVGAALALIFKFLVSFFVAGQASPLMEGKKKIKHTKTQPWDPFAKNRICGKS